MLVNRMKILSSVRRFFDSRGYLEAETPMLQIEAGGAAARRADAGSRPASCSDA